MLEGMVGSHRVAYEFLNAEEDEGETCEGGQDEDEGEDELDRCCDDMEEGVAPLLGRHDPVEGVVERHGSRGECWVIA